MKGLTYADTHHLRSATSTALRLPGLPVEFLRSQVERIAQVGAGNGTLIPTVSGIVVRRIDASDGDPLEVELPGRLVDKRLDGRRDLVLARSALGPPRRCVGQHSNAPKTHRQRGIDDGHGARGTREVTESGVRAVLLYDVQIDRSYPSVGSEADLDTPLKTRSCRSEEVLLGAADAHHDGPAGLLRHVRGDGHDGIPAAFRPESTAAVLGDEHQVLGLDAHVSGDPRHGAALALTRSVQIALAVLPIRHGAARLHGVVGMTRGHERLVEHESRIRKTALEVAVRPLGRGLAHRQRAVLGRREVLLRPLDFLQALPRDHGVAAHLRVRAPGPQALQRIHRKRQRLQVHLDPRDRVLCYSLADGRNGQNRLAHVAGFIREDGVSRRRDRRHFVCRQHGHHARHPQRFGRIDAAHPAVRHRAQKQTAEQHSVRAEVLRVLRAARHFPDHVGWHEILA